MPSYEGTNNLFMYAIGVAKDRRIVKSVDPVIAIHGNSETEENRANILKILEVDEAFNYVIASRKDRQSGAKISGLETFVG